jgi:hypothetical protein
MDTNPTYFSRTGQARLPIALTQQVKQPVGLALQGAGRIAAAVIRQLLSPILAAPPSPVYAPE